MQPQQPADPFCEMLDSWFANGFKQGATFEDFQMMESLKARYRDLVSRARQCTCSSVTDAQLASMRQEVEQWRAFLYQQQENLASYAARSARDLARAEELKLRPQLLKLMPVLDALALTVADARRPDAEARHLAEALDMVKQGLSGHIEGVRALLPAP